MPPSILKPTLRPTLKPIPVWMAVARTALSLILVLGSLSLSMGAADVTLREAKLGHRTMCTCGCAQLLGECNHVGCPNSPGMLKTLHADVAGGLSDHEILVDFQQKYGPAALASPLLTRFNQAAWFVPPAVLMLGLLGALVLIRRWRDSQLAEAAHAPAPTDLSPNQAAALARVRQDTEEL